MASVNATTLPVGRNNMQGLSLALVSGFAGGPPTVMQWDGAIDTHIQPSVLQYVFFR